MRYFDISMSIHPDMQVYKNRETNKPRISLERTHERDSVFESRLEIQLHTGTHLDAPLHMLSGGATIETFPLELSNLECRVLDLTAVEDKITAEDLADKNIQPGQALLFKTENSFHEYFQMDYISVSRSGAEFLSQQNIPLVGIDSLGIERGQSDHETHKIIMSAGVWILEGLRLAGVEPGDDYRLLVLPLNIAGAEASPVRAVLYR